MIPSSFPIFAIIVAGGSGSRMQTSLPKQFIEIGGLPVLMHTIRRFIAYAQHLRVILVLPEKDIITWQQLCDRHQFTSPVLTVAGGPTRFDSVSNGLAAIPDMEGLVAIHDGVRPFVSMDTIRKSYEVAYQKGCAVAVVDLKDSIRRIDAHGNSYAEERQMFRLVQTPQTFRLSVIKESFRMAASNHAFTDDASVAEKAGFPVYLIEGAYENIKITTPEDLLWAEAFVKRKKS